MFSNPSSSWNQLNLLVLTPSLTLLLEAALIYLYLSLSIFSNLVYLNSVFLHYGSKLQLFLSSKEETVPLLATTNSSRFLTICLKYFNLLYMTIFHMTSSLNGIPVSHESCNLFWLYSPLVGAQRQADAIYFDLTSAFDLVPHTMLLQKLCALGFSGSYVNWFHSYITNIQSQVHLVEQFLRLLKCSLVLLKYLFWGRCFSIVILLIFVINQTLHVPPLCWRHNNLPCY
jgi:hypothetical protein